MSSHKHFQTCNPAGLPTLSSVTQRQWVFKLGVRNVDIHSSGLFSCSSIPGAVLCGPSVVGKECTLYEMCVQSGKSCALLSCAGSVIAVIVQVVCWDDVCSAVAQV